MRQDLLQLIDNNDFISFDIFDTLLFRKIYRPTDIFRILSNIALEKFNIENFYNIRVEAEKEARTIENNFECHYNDIYKVIKGKIKNKEVCLFLKNEELKLEEKFLVVNPFMKEIFDYCKNNNKKIFLISDMYLDEKYLINILNREGYNNFTLYLSNKYHKTKGDGSLFEFVFDKEKISKDKWLHIGDNYNSDFNSPRKLGINAFHYPNINSFNTINSFSVFESIMLGIQNIYLHSGIELEYWDKFGIECVSPIYFGFTKWLYELTKNSDNLYFIARDGYIIQKIYSLFDDTIKSKYLYCSRKSLVIPSLYILDDEDIIRLLSIMYNDNVNHTLGCFLKKCGLDLGKIDKGILSSFGFKSFDIKITKNNFYNLKKMLVVLIPLIKSTLEDDYNKVYKYLKQEGLFNYDKVNIMDIGWAGSIQNSIHNIIGKDVVGYYFGTVDEKQKNAFTSMFGYYFDLGNEAEDEQVVLDNVMMYELIFSAPHGSTVCYKEAGDRIEPVLKENIEYNDIVLKFQTSAINIIKEYVEFIDYFDYISKDFCVYSYKKLIENKNYEDVKEFSKLSNDYILNSDKEFSYVNNLTMQEVDNNELLLKKSRNSLWNYTFFVDDDNFTKDNYLYYKSRLNSIIFKETPLKYVKIYFDYGNGFDDFEYVYVPYEVVGNQFSFSYELNKIKKLKNIKNVKFRLVEDRKIIIRHLIMYSEKGNLSIEIPNKSKIIGKLKRCIYIKSDNPEIIVRNVEQYDVINFTANLEII